MSKQIVKTITLALNALFPHNDPTSRMSVFVQDTWLQKFTRPLFIKDLAWSMRK